MLRTGQGAQRSQSMASTTLPPPTLGIRHIALRVRDLAASEGFYTGLLGYRVEWRPDPDNVYLTSGGDNLALHRAARAGPVQDAADVGALDHFGILLRSPEDVDAWARHLRAGGAALQAEPRTHRDGARSFYVRDPEGNMLQFIYHPPLSGD